MTRLVLTPEQCAAIQPHLKHGYTLLGRIWREQFDGTNGATSGRLIIELGRFKDDRLPALRAAITGTEVPVKPKKKPKPAAEHTVFIERWMSYYEKTLELKYPFGARDAKAAKTLLAHFKTTDAAFVFIEACHKRMREGFPFSNTTTLYDLANNLARLSAALTHGTNLKASSNRNLGTRNDGAGEQYKGVGKVAPVAAIEADIFGAGA